MAVTEHVTGRRSSPTRPSDPGGPEAEPAAGSGTLGKIRLPIPVVLYLLTVIIPISFKLGPLLMTSLRFFLLILIVPLLIRLLTGAYGKVLLTDILFIAHIGWAAVALSVNNPSQVVQQIGSVGIEFLGGYVVGRAYIRTGESFSALCRALVIIVLMTLPFALFEAVTSRPLIIELLRKIPGVNSVAIISIQGRMGLERVQGVFAHPIHYGLFCSLALSLAFVGLKDVSSTIWRYLSSVLIAMGAFLSLSSGALLAVVLQVSLISWSSVFASVKQRWWILLGLFALAYVVIDALSNRKPLDVFMTYATFSSHNAYWRGIIFEWGMKSVWQHPLYGIGLKDWVRPVFMKSSSVDNFWLLMAMRYGIPGFAALAIGYIVATAQVMRRDFSADPMLTLFRRAWVFTFLGLSFTISTVHIWTNIYSFVFFMFGAGLWMITASNGNATSGMDDDVPDIPAPRRSGPGPGAVRSAIPPAIQPVVIPKPAARPAPPPLSGTSRKTGPAYSRFSSRARETTPPRSDKDPVE